MALFNCAGTVVPEIRQKAEIKPRKGNINRLIPENLANQAIQR